MIEPTGFISSIQFNNDKEIELNKNDIIIFVGANNVGKSQCLKDLYTLLDKENPTKIIKKIQLEKDLSLSISLLESISSKYQNGNYYKYEVLGESFSFSSGHEKNIFNRPFYGDLRNLFVVNLNTSTRLNISEPPNNINFDDPRTHPIHYVSTEKKYRQWLSENFKKAFHKDLIPFKQNGKTIPLSIGTIPKLNSKDFNEDAQEYLEEYEKILRTFDQVQDQGDGIKSFVGILLYLMLEYLHIFLIDEPESFLHPPQAKQLGRIIGENLNNQQAFIATHSEDFIKGILEKIPERVKIIRITRDENKNSFRILNNEEITRLWTDPILNYSNFLSSLFYPTVVLCESDSDCSMYSSIESHLKEKAGFQSEILFLNCSGKSRISSTARALKSFGIDVHTIVDIDILNDKTVLKNLCDSFKINWCSIESNYNILRKYILGLKETKNRKQFLEEVIRLVNLSEDEFISNQELSKIKTISKVSEGWSILKKQGQNCINDPNVLNSFNNMISIFKAHGIHIVPVGELENFIPVIKSHGPKWVIEVFNKFPNLEDEVYESLKKFIIDLRL